VCHCKAGPMLPVRRTENVRCQNQKCKQIIGYESWPARIAKAVELLCTRAAKRKSQAASAQGVAGPKPAPARSVPKKSPKVQSGVGVRPGGATEKTESPVTVQPVKAAPNKPLPKRIRKRKASSPKRPPVQTKTEQGGSVPVPEAPISTETALENAEVLLTVPIEPDPDAKEGISTVPSAEDAVPVVHICPHADSPCGPVEEGGYRDCGCPECVNCPKPEAK
jgi:hypothetical protein